MEGTLSVLLLLLNLLGHQVTARPLVTGHLEVFSDLLENIMYSVIRRDSSLPLSTDGARGLEPPDMRESESKARRRVLLRKVPVSSMNTREGGSTIKTREEENSMRTREQENRSKIRDQENRFKTRDQKNTNSNQTLNFFNSKKIISRQRNRNVRHKKTEETNNVRHKETEETNRTNISKDVDERLQKVKELFQLIKASKKHKMKSRPVEPSPELDEKTKFLNFPSKAGYSGAIVGDNPNDILTNTMVGRRDELKKDKVKANNNETPKKKAKKEAKKVVSTEDSEDEDSVDESSVGDSENSD